MSDVQLLIIIHLFAKVGFAANDAATGLKIVEKGFRREDLAIVVLIDFPFQIIGGWLAAKWSRGDRPLRPWVIAFWPRLAFALIAALIVCLIVGPASLAQPQTSPDSILRHAVQLHQAGDVEAAIREYRSYLKPVPDSVMAHSNLGAALSKSGNYEEAIAEYSQALQKDPGNVPIRVNLAQPTRAIVLNAKSPAGYNDSKALYDWGFLNFDALEAKATDVIVPLTPASSVPAGAKKAGVPLAEAAAGVVPSSHPEHDPVPLDDVLLGVVVASVIGAWFLSSRRGTNDAYRGGPRGSES